MNTAKTGLKHIMSAPWIWAYLAAFVVWLATVLFTGGQGSIQILLSHQLCLYGILWLHG